MVFVWKSWLVGTPHQNVGLSHPKDLLRRYLEGYGKFANRKLYMDVSENSGTPKSSILIGFSIINHPFWGTTIFGNTHIGVSKI